MKVQSVENGGTTDAGEPVVVLCNLLGAQAPYTLDAVFRIGPAGNQRFINLGGSVALGQTNPGGLVLTSPDLPSQYGSSPDDPCMYSMIELDPTTGSVWGEFTCGILDDSDEMDICAVGPSYFFFENCTGP
jgi:hypothetical protein